MIPPIRNNTNHTMSRRTRDDFSEKGVIIREVENGVRCEQCKTNCPGFLPHEWRKTCQSCKCPRETHAIYQQQTTSVHERLGFKVISTTDSGVEARDLGYTWVPLGMCSSSRINRYFEQLPSNKVPKIGTEGARYREQQISHQLPKQDLSRQYCKHLESQHESSFEDFVMGRNEIALDIGYVKDAPYEENCAHCEGEISIGEMVVAAPKFMENVMWHPRCFVCSTCNNFLVDLTYCVHDDKIYCERHYGELLKPRCAGCDEATIHSHIMGELFESFGGLMFSLVIGYIGAIEFLYMVRHLYHWSFNHEDDATIDNNIDNLADLQESIHKQLTDATNREMNTGYNAMRDGVLYKDGFRLDSDQTLIDNLTENLNAKGEKSERYKELEKELAEQMELKKQIEKDLQAAEAAYKQQKEEKKETTEEEAEDKKELKVKKTIQEELEKMDTEYIQQDRDRVGKEETIKVEEPKSQQPLEAAFDRLKREIEDEVEVDERESQKESQVQVNPPHDQQKHDENDEYSEFKEERLETEVKEGTEEQQDNQTSLHMDEIEWPRGFNKEENVRVEFETPKIDADEKLELESAESNLSETLSSSRSNPDKTSIDNLTEMVKTMEEKSERYQQLEKELADHENLELELSESDLYETLSTQYLDNKNEQQIEDEINKIINEQEVVNEIDLITSMIQNIETQHEQALNNEKLEQLVVAKNENEPIYIEHTSSPLQQPETLWQNENTSKDQLQRIDDTPSDQVYSSSKDSSLETNLKDVLIPAVESQTLEADDDIPAQLYTPDYLRSLDGISYKKRERSRNRRAFKKQRSSGSSNSSLESRTSREEELESFTSLEEEEMKRIDDNFKPIVYTSEPPVNVKTHHKHHKKSSALKKKQIVLLEEALEIQKDDLELQESPVHTSAPVNTPVDENAEKLNIRKTVKDYDEIGTEEGAVTTMSTTKTTETQPKLTKENNSHSTPTLSPKCFNSIIVPEEKSELASVPTTFTERIQGDLDSGPRKDERDQILEGLSDFYDFVNIRYNKLSNTAQTDNNNITEPERIAENILLPHMINDGNEMSPLIQSKNDFNKTGAIPKVPDESCVTKEPNYEEMRRQNAQFRRSGSRSRSPLNKDQLRELEAIEMEARDKKFRDKILDEMARTPEIFNNNHYLFMDHIKNNRRASESVLFLRKPEIIIQLKDNLDLDSDNVYLEPREYGYVSHLPVHLENEMEDYNDDDFIFVHEPYKTELDYSEESYNKDDLQRLHEESVNKLLEAQNYKISEAEIKSKNAEEHNIVPDDKQKESEDKGKYIYGHDIVIDENYKPKKEYQWRINFKLSEDQEIENSDNKQNMEKESNNDSQERDLPLTEETKFSVSLEQNLENESVLPRDNQSKQSSPFIELTEDDLDISFKMGNLKNKNENQNMVVLGKDLQKTEESITDVNVVSKIKDEEPCRDPDSAAIAQSCEKQEEKETSQEAVQTTATTKNNTDPFDMFKDASSYPLI